MQNPKRRKPVQIKPSDASFERPDFRTRSVEPEIMDDFNLRNEALFQTLRELDFINKWLGGNAITLKRFKQLLKNQPLTQISIADWGCGSGDMLIKLHNWIAKRPIQSLLYGIDANQAIIDFAKEHTQKYPAIQYICSKVENTKHQPFDVITARCLLIISLMQI